MTPAPAQKIEILSTVPGTDLGPVPSAGPGLICSRSSSPDHFTLWVSDTPEARTTVSAIVAAARKSGPVAIFASPVSSTLL